MIPINETERPVTRLENCSGKFKCIIAIIFLCLFTLKYISNPMFSQMRGCVILDTDEFGLVALIPMGMAQVSSINFEEGVQEGTTHKKGDMLGNFLFGGSDFIMFFRKKADLEIMVQQNEDMRTYKHILMCVKYGVMKGGK